MADIPLTTEPADPTRGDIPIMGLAASFIVRHHRGHCVLDEIVREVTPSS